MTSRIFAALAAGFTWNSAAATPVTCGVAIEVPESNLYPLGSHREHGPVGTVESVETPGAAMSTVAKPTFEK